MSYIKRAIERIIDNNFRKSKALVVTGARQVGKTTVTKHLYPDVQRINMKDRLLINASKEDPLSFLEGMGMPLFIDEIQNTPYLIDELKVILDETDSKGNYILSGSQKWKLMKGLTESLAGIASILEMTTLSLREIKSISFDQPFSLNEKYLKEREKHLQKYENIWEYIHRGFYPELYDDDPRYWGTYYNDYVSTYLEKDVYDILKVRDPDTFYRFMVSCAARTGNILNYSNIASDVGIDADTVKSWTGILEKTGIIYLLKPYYNSHLNRALKSPKIYFRDTGLAAHLTNWTTPEQLQAGAMNGAFFETFVLNEILKSYINAGLDHTRYVYYYRGRDKRKNSVNEYEESEIDFIIEENNTLYPIEIRKNKNVTASMTSAFNVLDKDKSKKRGTGAIICTCDHKLKLSADLYALPVEYI